MTAESAAFSFGDDPVRPELIAALERTWAEIASPGTWWSGDERVAIAGAARQAFVGDSPPTSVLPSPASEAAGRVAATPGTLSEAWVNDMTGALGELRYIELVGIVARVIAVDTFCRLTGRFPAELPSSRPGEPSREPPPANLRRERTWVSMAMPAPPYVLGAVPAAEAAMNDLTHRLYMDDAQMGDPDLRRGDLHRTQMELVAAAVSHTNECFY